jgi:flagellar protein FliO/FliZ
MLEMVLRIGFSLLVVLGLLWLLGRVIRRPLAGRAAGALAVLARQQVTRGASVALVRVVDRALILGVTDGHVTLLGEAELAALSVPADEHREPVPGQPSGRLDGSVLSPHTWSQTVEFLRSRTARR